MALDEQTQSVSILGGFDQPNLKAGRHMFADLLKRSRDLSPAVCESCPTVRDRAAASF
jgi:hypothetical protein